MFYFYGPRYFVSLNRRLVSACSVHKMKINVVHKDGRFIVNVLDTNMIWEVKEMIAKSLRLSLNFRSKRDKKNEDDEIEENNDGVFKEKEDTDGTFLLYCNGSTLNDDCTVAEIGLVSGSTIRCRHIQMSPYALRITIRSLGRNIDLRDEIVFETTTLGELRSLIEKMIGIPISIFYLQQTTEKRDLFDHRLLSYYGIKLGDTLYLELWKGTRDLIVAALNDDISQTLSAIPSYHDNPIMNRYYLKVALFIAAHFDSVNLAAQVIQRGVRCDDPVGEYPSRQWCLQQSHPHVFKTPVHQAAMRGSFRILNVFLRHSPACIVAKDGNNRSPSIYASQNGHMECWKLLMVAQFQFQSICGFSLVTYAKIMKWCNKARDRIIYFKAENKKQLLLHSQLYPSDSTCLGDPIVINGYHDTGRDYDMDRKKVDRVSSWSNNMHGDCEDDPSSSPIESPRDSLSSVFGKHSVEDHSISDSSNSLKRDLSITYSSKSKSKSKSCKLNSKISTKPPNKSSAISGTKSSAISGNTSAVSSGTKSTITPGTKSANTLGSNSAISGTKSIMSGTRSSTTTSGMISVISGASTSTISGTSSATISDINSASSSTLSHRTKRRLRKTNKQNAHIEARNIIYKSTGKTPTQIASKCFQMGQTFDKMKWRSQMDIALKCSVNCIERNLIK